VTVARLESNIEILKKALMTKQNEGKWISCFRDEHIGFPCITAC